MVAWVGKIKHFCYATEKKTLLISLLAGVLCAEAVKKQEVIYSYIVWLLYLCGIVYLGVFGLVWLVHKDCPDLFYGEGSVERSSRGRKIWNSAIFAVCWSIWLERNNRIFDNMEEHVDSYLGMCNLLGSFMAFKRQILGVCCFLI